MRVYEEEKRICKMILAEYPADQIILFGSRARGEEVKGSDIDFLVVSDHEKDLPPVRRGLGLRKKLGMIQTPLDILFYSHEDMKRYKNIPQSFPATILREGIILYDRRKKELFT